MVKNLEELEKQRLLKGILERKPVKPIYQQGMTVEEMCEMISDEDFLVWESELQKLHTR